MTKRLAPVALLFWSTSSVLWAQDPVGPEFRVNSYTTGYQHRPAVASDANGNFVVVWHGDGWDGSYRGISGQRFDAAGLPQGNEFVVNSYTTGPQGSARVASDANGNFVVVWDSLNESYRHDVFGQRFSASGLPDGSAFQVNNKTTDLASHDFTPAVASDPNGNFVVVWTRISPDPAGVGILGRRFDTTGLPQGSEFQVNSNPSAALYPQVASDEIGNFVVVWGNVRGQRFDAAGLPLGSEFQVNSYTTSAGLPAVASDAAGNFLVVWHRVDSWFSHGVFGQRFNAAGVPQGNEFQVSSYPAGEVPQVASDANGTFVVVWQNSGQDGSGWGVFGRRLDAAGIPQGSEFTVNSFTQGHQNRAAVASANGSFVVVWGSDGQDGSGYGVFGQRYGDIIFRDGFE